LVKALARAFRWRKLLETGVFATVVVVEEALIVFGTAAYRIVMRTDRSILTPALTRARVCMFHYSTLGKFTEYFDEALHASRLDSEPANSFILRRK
jgi:hypothetical protein